MFAGFLSVLLILVVGTTAASQPAQTLPKGQLVQNVESKSSPGQRFAVYIPRSYDASRPAPVLYLLDPRGRARLAAGLFQPAAERYGYIIFSSYNSASDGPPEVTLRGLQAMWTDSHDWLHLDERRAYLAGFSGTARMASLIARNRREAIAGIIGAGAGFHPDVKPDPRAAFLYFGTTGDEDYNFHEIETLERSLVALDLPHRIERFHGPHSWMPAALAMRAIEWLELRAMQSGLKARDSGLIDAWWKRDEEAAAGAMAAGRTLDAGRAYAAMARDFAGVRDTAQVKALAEETLAAPQAMAERSRRQTEGQRSRQWVQAAMRIIAEAYPVGADAPVSTPDDLARALDVPGLRKAGAGSDAPAREAKRRLNELDVQLGFYLPFDALNSLEPQRARYYLSTALLIDDRDPVTLYLLSASHAHTNGRREALDALRRAIDAGFRDLSLLERDRSFQRLRTDPQFLALVERLRASGDALDLLTVDRPPLPIPVR
jgi:dienelactone hydrolase